MAWVKIPAENHPIFLAAVPKDPRVTTLKMFGGIAAKANGQMFGGLFGKSFVVKLSEADQKEALALDGAAVFDPMGNGRVMTDTIFMPEETFGDGAELAGWLRRSFDYVLTRPAKADKKSAAAKQQPTAKQQPAPKKQSAPAKKAAPPKKTAAVQGSANKPSTKKAPTKKPATKKPTAKKS